MWTKLLRVRQLIRTLLSTSKSVTHISYVKGEVSLVWTVLTTVRFKTNMSHLVSNNAITKYALLLKAHGLLYDLNQPNGDVEHILEYLRSEQSKIFDSGFYTPCA